jgi:hypothetical protein
MLKVILNPAKVYNEESQQNPLRWWLLQPKGEVLESIAGPMKCKDFFNDIVYTLNTGKVFSIYQFNSEVVKKLKKGDPLYFLLTSTATEFINNVEKTLNPWLEAQGAPPLLLIPSDQGLVLSLAPFYYKNTYNISLIALLVRMFNIDVKLTKMEDLTDKTVPYGDWSKWNPVKQRGYFFKLPESVDKFIWWQGSGYNNEVITEECSEGYTIPQLVHNNGVLNWTKNL